MYSVGLTMARWKSGLLPFEVIASKVNCETHRISPSMSLTFFFHICPAASENTLSWRLHVSVNDHFTPR